MAAPKPAERGEAPPPLQIADCTVKLSRGEKARAGCSPPAASGEALALKSAAIILQRQLIELHRIDGRGFVDANNFKIRLLITLVEALDVSGGWARGGSFNSAV